MRLAEECGGFLGDAGALEKFGVLGAPQPHRVRKGEVAEIVGGDQPVLDQLVGLGQGLQHIRHVEMADVRTEDRVDPGAERIGPAEGGDVHPVVGLAAEIIGLSIEIEPILLAGDLARCVIVVDRDPAIDRVLLAGGPAVAPVELSGDVGIAVLVDVFAQQGAVELVGVHVGEALGAAPLPMLDQIGEQLAAPADPAFEKAEAQLREAPGDAAEEQGLGDRMAGGGEMADMVEGEIRRRVALAIAAAAGVKGRGDLQFAAFLPDRVVIMLAVDAELVEADGKAGERRVNPLGRGQTAGDAAAEHAHLGAQLPGHEFELGQRLLGRVHRDHRGRGQPVAELGEIIGADDVEAADHRAPGLAVGDAVNAEPGGRVDDAEIEAELIEAVVEHARHHRGGAVAGIGRLPAPIAFHADATALALLDREVQRIGDPPLRRDKPVSRLVAGRLAHFFSEDRRVLDPMPVAVDDRMAEFRMDLLGLACALMGCSGLVALAAQ